MSKYVWDPNIVGKHSAFDKNMSDKYDIPAREKVKELLKEAVINNPEDCKQDMIITDPKCKYKYLELQVCTNWINNFPYSNPYIFARKYKYGDDTLFLTFSKNLDKGLIFEAKSIKNVKPRRLKKYSREFVYDVPWHKVMQFHSDAFDMDILLKY